MRKINFVINPNPYPIGLDGRIIKKYSILYLGDSNVKYVESIYQKLFSTGKLIHAATYWDAFDSILCYLPHDLKVRALSQNFYPIQNINEETLRKLLSEIWKREDVIKKEEVIEEETIKKEEATEKEEITKEEETIKEEDAINKEDTIKKEEVNKEKDLLVKEDFPKNIIKNEKTEAPQEISSPEVNEENDGAQENLQENLQEKQQKEEVITEKNRNIDKTKKRKKK